LFQSGIAQQTSDMLGRLPPIGLAREQTEAWRELAAAHAHCQQIENELRGVLLQVQFDALDLLSERVRKRGAADSIDSFRALYDLWVECGEQAYSKLAHSEAYSKLQAELGNATMRLRARMQTVIEHGLKQFDLPTRSELNSLHRQVRELRVQLERLTARSQPAPKRAARAAPQKAKSQTRAKSKARDKSRRK
jgi:class III poly(R)-hydroxyalkanoic acid synthase PhaE subunit